MWISPIGCNMPLLGCNLTFFNWEGVIKEISVLSFWQLIISTSLVDHGMIRAPSSSSCLKFSGSFMSLYKIVLTFEELTRYLLCSEIDENCAKFRRNEEIPIYALKLMKIVLTFEALKRYIFITQHQLARFWLTKAWRGSQKRHEEKTQKSVWVLMDSMTNFSGTIHQHRVNVSFQF
jgi:hypothetical protein